MRESVQRVRARVYASGVAVGVTRRGADDAQGEAVVVSIVGHRRAAPTRVVTCFWIMKPRVEEEFYICK